MALASVFAMYYRAGTHLRRLILCRHPALRMHPHSEHANRQPERRPTDVDDHVSYRRVAIWEKSLEKLAARPHHRPAQYNYPALPRHVRQREPQQHRQHAKQTHVKPFIGKQMDDPVGGRLRLQSAQEYPGDQTEELFSPLQSE